MLGLSRGDCCRYGGKYVSVNENKSRKKKRIEGGTRWTKRARKRGEERKKEGGRDRRRERKSRRRDEKGWMGGEERKDIFRFLHIPYFFLLGLTNCVKYVTALDTFVTGGEV